MLIVHILYSVSYVVSPCKPEHISNNARRSCIFLKFVHLVFRWFNRIWIGVLYVIDLLLYHVKHVLTGFFSISIHIRFTMVSFQNNPFERNYNECVCFNYVSQTLQGATDNILLFIPLLAKRRCLQPSDVFTNQNSVKAVKTQFLSFVQKVHLHASTSGRLLAE